MTRPDLKRPVVIKMDNDLGENIIRTNMQTLEITKKTFQGLLAEVRGQGKSKKK